MKKFIGLLALFSLLSASALAKPILNEETVAKQVQKKLPQKMAFLVGGSGDELRIGDNFTTDFNEWNGFLRSHGWNVYGFVDSSKKTELEYVQNFDWEKFKDRLKSLAQNPPKQVLIAIFTHGNYEHGQHTIATESVPWAPIKELKTLLAELRMQGSQVALIDASCYSGYSVQELEETGACIMSMAGKEEGTAAITEPVARGLSSMPQMGKRPSVEDVWFSVLENSNARLTQKPQISAFWIPIFLCEEERENLKVFFQKEEKLFKRMFSAKSLSGIEEYLESGNYIANSMGVLGVLYLKKLPVRESRPCANFYF